jgi:phage I-like protein
VTYVAGFFVPGVCQLSGMTKTSPIAAIAIALNTGEEGTVPEWIQLLPAGQTVAGYDGRTWLNDRPEDLLAMFDRRPSGLPIDFEHGTEEWPDGKAKDIAGYIVELDLKDDGSVWGKADWTELGREKVGSRQYRHVSPAFFYDTNTNRVLELTSVALTVDPNLQLTALNRRGPSPEPNTSESTMDKEKRRALCRSLGLADEASDDAIIKAVEELDAGKAKAENAAQMPDVEKFVPRSDYDKVVGERDTALNSLKQTADAEIADLVDQAIKDGKIAPASKDYHLAACRSGPEGLKGFKAFIEGAPVLAMAENSGLDTVDPGKGKAVLSADEKKIADQLGLSHDDFAKDLAADKGAA